MRNNLKFVLAVLVHKKSNRARGHIGRQAVARLHTTVVAKDCEGLRRDCVGARSLSPAYPLAVISLSFINTIAHASYHTRIVVVVN